MNKKQQAQIYFAGQSRYLGVYKNSIDASVAFQVANSYLTKNIRKVTTKGEEANKIFAEARKSAALAVLQATKQAAKVVGEKQK